MTIYLFVILLIFHQVTFQTHQNCILNNKVEIYILLKNKAVTIFIFFFTKDIHNLYFLAQLVYVMVELNYMHIRYIKSDLLVILEIIIIKAYKKSPYLIFMSKIIFFINPLQN